MLLLNIINLFFSFYFSENEKKNHKRLYFGLSFLFSSSFFFLEGGEKEKGRWHGDGDSLNDLVMKIRQLSTILVFYQWLNSINYLSVLPRVSPSFVHWTLPPRLPMTQLMMARPPSDTNLSWGRVRKNCWRVRSPLDDWTKKRKYIYYYIYCKLIER